MADPTTVAVAAQAASVSGDPTAAAAHLTGLAAVMGWLNPSSGYAAQVAGNTLGYVGRIPGALFILLVGIISIRVIRIVVTRFSSAARLSPTLRSLIESIIGFVGWIVILASTLSALGLNQISVALGGSIALVAMALATGLNSITQDLMAGIFLISDEDFHVGYRVQTGGIEGTVEKLSVRKTKLRTDDGKLHVIPNRTVDAATYIIIKAPPVPPAPDKEVAG